MAVIDTPIDERCDVAGGRVRRVFDRDQQVFRGVVRRFARSEVHPFEYEWWRAGAAPRAIWERAGEVGLLCPQAPEDYGGAGLDDYRYLAVISEELRSPSLAFDLQSQIIGNYLLHYGDEALQRRFLPGLCTGKLIFAIAMTEPGTGSDLAAVTTRARREGGDYVISGQKTFISAGSIADVIIVVCKTSPDLGARGVSLILVEADRLGVRRGPPLAKLGRKGADTAELFFADVRVPVGNLLGAEGDGFTQLMEELPQERLGIAHSAVIDAQRAFDLALEHARTREAFGRTLIDFQNTRFVLASAKADLDAAWALIDNCILQHVRGELSAEDAAAAKLWTTEMQGRVIDDCLQIFGGYGYMEEYEITRLYANARAQRIYGGTSEIMREVIGRGLAK